MRRPRFLLPFTLGALSMLVLVAAGGWFAPGMLDRLLIAVRPGLASSATALAPAPADSTPSAPIVVEAPGPVPVPPAPIVAAPEVTPNGGDPLRLLIPVQGVRAGATTPSTSWRRGARPCWR
jgi:hypothetical protein